MEFYRMLSEHYEKIFPLNNKVVEMVVSQTPDEGKVLDVGCAKGELVRELVNRGYDAEGLEYVPELIGYPERTIEGDMHSLPYEDETFDTLVCTGNTLVHSFDVPSVMTEFSRVLKSGGKAVIQILNYDRILTAKPQFLPKIAFESYSFIREYDYKSDYIEFIGTITGGGETVSSSVRLKPLKTGDLQAEASGAGLNTVLLFGGFDRSDHNHESYATVIVLEKK